MITKCNNCVYLNLKHSIFYYFNLKNSLTKDGQFVYVDWIPQKDADSSKLTSGIFCTELGPGLEPTTTSQPLILNQIGTLIHF